MTDSFNQLQTNNFKFEIQRLPNLSFFIKSLNLPGVQIGSIDSTTPFSIMPNVGDKLQYNELNVEFLVQEDMTNYFEIVDWMRGISFAENYDEYKAEVITKDQRPWTDATLIIMNNTDLPQHEIVFKELFPIAIDDIPFNLDSEISIPVNVTFRFRSWKNRKIT